MQTDRVFVQGLVLEGILGIHAYERETPQRIVIDIEANTDAYAAARRDDIAAAAIDYAELRRIASHHACHGQYRLVETLAEAIANAAIAELDLSWIRVRVAKPDAFADAASVGVVIERAAPARPTG